MIRLVVDNDRAGRDAQALVRKIEGMLAEKDEIIKRYRELYGELDDLGEDNAST